MRPVDAALAMADSIAERIPNPAEWPIECRRIAEELGLRVAIVEFSRRLESTCISICTLAAGNGVTVERMLEVGLVGSALAAPTPSP
jgi:hypothetical protein